MKYITILDDENNEVLAQFGEEENGTITGICNDGIHVVVDGELLNTEDEESLQASSAMNCSCGASSCDLDIVKTLTSYMNGVHLADVEIEYKVVCSKCGREGELSRNKEGAILSWNEGLIKEKIQ